MKAFDFAKYLLDLDPKSNAARLSLYHYSKNHSRPDQELNADFIQSFYEAALSFDHWRENRKELANEVQNSLSHFLAHHQTEIKNLRHCDEMQIVPIESIKDLYEIAKNYTSSKRLEGDRIRLLPDNEDGIIAITLKFDGRLFINYFDHLTVVRAGQLEPLRKDLVVQYSSQLELTQGFEQHVQIQPGITCRFQYQNGQVVGRMFRGFTFQKIEDFSTLPLTQIPALFYPLKRLERFFINRSTDPLYKELTTLLDQSIILLREKHPDSLRLGTAALERGQNAVKFIFPDDNLLALLLRELSSLLMEKVGAPQAWQKFD